MNNYFMSGKLMHKASDHNTKRCEVEKWVFLPHSDFERLKANPYQEHEAITAARDLMYEDKNAYHCIMLLDEHGDDGLLIEAEGFDYPRLSMFVPDAALIYERYKTSEAELTLHDMIRDTVEKIAELVHTDKTDFTSADTATGRGYIPAGLIEEIKALSMPPVPWDVELAKWFDMWFAPVEKHRTYARPSRRQSSTPDIPRPNWVKPEIPEYSRTYAVIIDTSGSMTPTLIGKALGAAASYSVAKDVPLVRVVFCDAAAYDIGYVAPEDIAGRVMVKGRGGTVLQPAVDLIENARDFPKDGPILIITDAGIESDLKVHREHAFLIPEGRRLPFRPKGKVFYFK